MSREDEMHKIICADYAAFRAQGGRASSAYDLFLLKLAAVAKRNGVTLPQLPPRQEGECNSKPFVDFRKYRGT